MPNEPSTNTQPQPTGISLFSRLRVAAGLVVGLRKPDFQAAGTFVNRRFAESPWILKWFRFLGWALYQMLVVVPVTMRHLSIDGNVSKTPLWLTGENPLANHPWRENESASLPTQSDTVVIGAGFTGAALAYHWSKQAPASKRMIVLEMDDPASGSSGRNEGLVVMGRYCKMVRDTVLKHLAAVRPDLTGPEQDRLARQFAEHYCQAAYRNADLIEETIRHEGYDCGYSRSGWVQAHDAADQDALAASVEMAVESNYTDWTRITAAEVGERTGMHVDADAGFSQAAASWHPAKWVWCLFQTALATEAVELFTRTRVLNVEDEGEGYRIRTERGEIVARHVVYATESYTPRLHPEFHDVILPMQEQAASGDGGPKSMKPHVGISGSWFFAGRYGPRVLFGSGGSRVRDDEAGRNRPSRFLTKFVASEMLRYFGPYELRMKNEWSGTVGYTPDEFPIVGSIDDRGRYIIGGMCGSGSGVSFNGGRCIVNRILGVTGEPDDYPEAYFGPSRLLDPGNHSWPSIE